MGITQIAANIIGKLYVHEDQLGSFAYFTKPSGELFSYTELDEWGKPIAADILGMNYSGLDEVVDYTGHTYEGELKDPLILHQYTYEHNNPVFCVLRDEFEKRGN